VIRVLEVLATLKRAGAETVAVNLATRLNREHFETAVVSLFDPFPNGFGPQLAAAGVRTWHLGKRRGFDWRMYGRLRRVVREFRPDIIHTHSYVMRYTLGLPSRVKVHTVHNVATREVEPLGRLLHRVGFRRGVIPVAVGEEVARSFGEFYGFTPPTIPNGIDTRNFYRPEVRAAWRVQNGISTKDVLVVSVARLEPQKNPLGLLEAFRRADVPAHLLFAGDGSLRPQLAGANVLGVRTDLPELLSSCDIFALASHWEGQPLSVIEAMAAGLPVIATAVGGLPELVGDAGVLVPPGDTDAFAAALRALVTDTERRRRLGEAARERSRRFDVSGMVAAYADLFEELARS
jgi:glycosyltransferase involved in cell wall biosynthesis